MSFQTPQFIENYLNLDWRKPPQNFVNTSQFYTGLDPFFIDYLNTVVRPCMAYSKGVADGTINSGIKMNVGYTIKKTAVRLLKGDKVIFEGRDEDTAFLSDVWGKSVNFDRFYEATLDNLMEGTTIIKINKDARGRCVPVTERVDRYYPTYDDSGELIHCVIFNSLVYQANFGNSIRNVFWLVEERYYRGYKKYVRYKVQAKSGIAGQEILPTITGDGIPEKDLPESTQALVKAKGIRLNEEVELPFRDGLGVWNLTLTANNSVVPNLPMGDPLLFGALDLLWAIDVVFSGSLTDVLLGKGKVLVPKRFLHTIRGDLKGLNLQVTPNESVTDKIIARIEAQSDDDDSFVYVATEHDKDFPPQSVQFDIRSEQYRGMFEMYLRQVVSMCGFAPTSVFPFLEDKSAKTATEVTAEDNLTRSTVQSIHQMIAPVISRLLTEVVYQLYNDSGEDYDGQISVKLSDYIGNPLLRDQNTRENYTAGLIPKEVAVQKVNSTSDKETAEYVAKIDAEAEAKRQAETPNFSDFYDVGGENDVSESKVKPVGADS